jgi:tetratricopeptide (TPR) repeat protein
VPASLLSLVRKDLLRPADAPIGGRGGFQFHHLLMRDVTYASIPKQTRAELHERYAGWLGEAVGARAREYEEIIGYHLERAGRFLGELGPVDAHGQELASRAAGLLAAAGRRAVGRGDLPAATNLLNRAVALLPTDDAHRPFLLIQLAEALVLDAAFDPAGQLLDEALDAAARTGDEGLRAHATLGKLNLRLDAAPDRSTPGQRPFRDEVHSALETLERLGDEQGQASAWRLLGLDSYLHCLIAPAEREFQRAIEHARRADDERLEATTLYVLTQAAFWSPTPVADAIRRCEQVRRQAQGNYRLELAALHTLAALHAMQGRFELARALADTSRAIAEELGPNRLAAICSQFLGAIAMLAGDPAGAEARLRWGYGILERMGERGLRSELAAGLARALWAQGHNETALHFGRLSGELAVRDDLYAQVERRGPMARVLAERGNLAEAERLAREAVAMAQQTDMIDMRATALVDLAEVLVLGGRTGEATSLAREALGLYQHKGNLVLAARTRELLGRLGDGT